MGTNTLRLQRRIMEWALWSKTPFSLRRNLMPPQGLKSVGQATPTTTRSAGTHHPTMAEALLPVTCSNGGSLRSRPRLRRTSSRGGDGPSSPSTPTTPTDSHRLTTGPCPSTQPTPAQEPRQPRLRQQLLRPRLRQRRPRQLLLRRWLLPPRRASPLANGMPESRRRIIWRTRRFLVAG